MMTFYWQSKTRVQSNNLEASQDVQAYFLAVTVMVLTPCSKLLYEMSL